MKTLGRTGGYSQKDMREEAALDPRTRECLPAPGGKIVRVVKANIVEKERTEDMFVCPAIPEGTTKINEQ